MREQLSQAEPRPLALLQEQVPQLALRPEPVEPQPVHRQEQVEPRPVPLP